MRMRHAAVVAGLALGLMSGAAKAAYIVDIDQVGMNVVVSGSGSIDLGGSSKSQFSNFRPSISSSTATITTGQGNVQLYTTDLVGPSAFGTSGIQFADLYSGLPVGILNGTRLIVPQNYVSGSLGLSTSTYLNKDLADLGLTAGTRYEYSFPGSGESFDTFTINVNGMSPVPLPASAPMFGAAILALGAVGYGMKRKKAAAAV